MSLQNKGVNLITILNVYAHNNRASKYLKQKLTELKEKKNGKTQNYSWKLQHYSHSRKSVKDWNKTIHQLDLIDIYRIFYPTTLAYTFYSGPKD